MIEFDANLAQFHRALSGLDRRVGTRIVRRAVSAAARIFRGAVRSAAPVRSGTLRRAIYIKRSRRSRRGEEIYFVSVRSGAKYGLLRVRGRNRDAYYWRWVESGHLVRGRGQRLKGGSNSRNLQRSRLRTTGARAVPANPFIQRGFRSGRAGAMREFEARMSTDLGIAARDFR